METLGPTLGVLLVQLPLLLVWLTGLVLAVVFWKRHPRVSLLALIAILGLMIISILSPLWSIWLGMWMDRFGPPFGQSSIAVLVSQVAISLISAVFWALVIFAIFGWRRKQEATQ